MVDERFTRLYTSATTIDELWHLVVSWAAALVHAIQSLYDSMTKRVTAVIAAEGGCSRYWAGL